MGKLSARSAVFYVLMVVVLLVLVTKAQKHFLPGFLATEIGHNSEAFVFALLVAAEIQLRRALGPSARLVLAVGGAVVLVGIGVALLHSSLPPTVVTLNEPFIGAGLVGLYLLAPRSAVSAVVLFVAVVVFVVVFFDTSLVLSQAESLVPLALAGLALDVFDRTILRPGLEDQLGLRLGWMVLLLLVAVGAIFAARAARHHLVGPGPLTIDYLQRAAEAYWGWLLVHLYFSYWLGPLWRRDDSERRLAEPARGGRG